MSVMSLTATISTSAGDSCSRNTLELEPSLAILCQARRLARAGAERRAVHLAVLDLDEVLAALRKWRRAPRRSPPSGAGRRCSRSRSRDGPPPGHVLREPVLEQRHHALADFPRRRNRHPPGRI